MLENFVNLTEKILHKLHILEQLFLRLTADISFWKYKR